MWRFARSLPLVLLLALPATLAAPGPAAALTLPPGHLPGRSISTPPEEEAEEEAGDAEELEAEGEEAAEEAEGETEELVAPEECLLRTVRAEAVVYRNRDEVRLAIHYTSTAAARAKVDYRLVGARGSLKFREARERLGTAGVIRVSESLGRGAMARVAAAKSFTVELRLPATPGYCQAFDTRHLTVEHGGAGRETWLQAESAFGA